MFRSSLKTAPRLARASIRVSVRNSSTTNTSYNVSGGAKAAPGLKRSWWKYLAAAFVTGGVVGMTVSPTKVMEIALNNLPDINNESYKKMAVRDTEEQMQKLPIVKTLMKDSRFRLVRGWEGMDKNMQDHSLTGSTETMNRVGYITIPPYIFINDNDMEAVTVMHLGHHVAGYPYTVHGGVIATILDEALARAAFLAFPSRTGVTANLKITYKAPVRTDQFVTVCTRVTEATEKKALVTGTIETAEFQKPPLVEASAVFVVPKSIKLKPLSHHQKD
ncbi:UPF0644 protein [Yarrowia sp. C11]|nr:UPF0644 protein [Yarrowia sp. C11]KAG5364000.1 UPF0644 protein [Yarrowia sp. E02]